jgi:hypothetical protein
VVLVVVVGTVVVVVLEGVSVPQLASNIDAMIIKQTINCTIPFFIYTPLFNSLGYCIQSSVVAIPAVIVFDIILFT